ncbi:MAG: regulatory protein RecX [bacterium]
MKAPPASPVEAAIAYLTPRRRFEQEVRAYLGRLGFTEPVVEEALVRLAELGLVDDEETSRAWIRDRGRFAPRGRGLLRRELARRGVSEETVEAAMAEEVPPETEADLALAVLEKSAGKWSGLTAPVARRRMWGALARRGFPPDAVREAIGRFAEARGFPDEGSND